MTNRVLRNVLYLPPLRLFRFITCDKIARYWLKDHRSVVLASRCLLIPLFMILSRNSAIQLRLSLRLLSLYNYSRDNSRVTKDSFKNAYSRVKPYVILMNSNATLVFPFATVVSMFFPRDGCLCSRDAMPAHMPMFLRCLCSFDVYVHAMSMFFCFFLIIYELCDCHHPRYYESSFEGNSIDGGYYCEMIEGMTKSIEIIERDYNGI